MSELLKIVLSLSLSGTLLFFIVLALKPLYKNKLSKRWQYYIWLIVIVRMLIPFTPETTLVGSAFQHLGNISVGTIQSAPPTNDVQSDFGVGDNYTTPNTEPQTPKSTIDTAPSLSIQTIIIKLYENLWMLWAAIAFALLIRKITMYQSFVRFVKAGRTEVADIEILNMLADAGETIGVKRPVELFINPLISSPMLLGFFRPYIILPSIELDKTELAYIMRHELTHYKHLDMFYKWLVQITVCLHWFNPFAYLMAKEINKCCELSCDEAIIRTMDNDEKRAYGDTLLNSLKTIGNYNDKLATVTLTEGAEQLKERLDAIMKFKQKSKSIVAITLALTTMLCVGATAVGAYAAPQTAIPQMPVTMNTSNKAEVSYAKEYAKWDITHIDDTYYYQNEPVRIFMDLRADNSFANFSYNKNGSIDLRLFRNSSDAIMKVEYMTKAEADEILSDLEENPSTKEDIKRLTLEEVPDAIQSAVNSCDDETWYVINSDGRQYIYYNNLPHNYAYQYEPKKNSLKVVDIGKSTGNYVLLSVPINSNLAISYNSKSVTYSNMPQTSLYKEQESSNTPWAAMGGTGQPYTYSQQGYYQGNYIFELGWNLNTKGYEGYSDKAELKLADLTTITVSFDKSCKSEVQNQEVLADLKELIQSLKKQYSNSSNPLEKPLVVSVKYVGDSDLVKLAEEYYTNGELTGFSAIFSSLDVAVQKEYCTKMIEDGKNTFLSSSARNMDSDMIDYCLEKTYQEGKIALFAGIAPSLTNDQKQTWITRASRDDKNNFLAVLTR